MSTCVILLPKFAPNHITVQPNILIPWHSLTNGRCRRTEAAQIQGWGTSRAERPAQPWPALEQPKTSQLNWEAQHIVLSKICMCWKFAPWFTVGRVKSDHKWRRILFFGCLWVLWIILIVVTCSLIEIGDWAISHFAEEILVRIQPNIWMTKSATNSGRWWKSLHKRWIMSPTRCWDWCPFSRIHKC